MTAAALKTGSTGLKLLSTATATKMGGPIFPVTEGRRYNVLVELQASSVASGRTVTIQVAWLDETKASLVAHTLFSSELTTADTWQCVRAPIAPPNGARYARITIEKAAQSFAVIVDRVRCDETAAGLDDALCEVRLVDDFLTDGTAAPWGDLGWTEFAFTNVAVSKIGAAAPSFDPYSEVGVVQVQSPTTNGQGGGLILGSLTRPMFYGLPPVGFEFRQKLRATATSGFVAWAGLWSSSSTYPDAPPANTISGIGFRATTTGGAANWRGVVRTGTLETTVDLGVAADTTWRTLGWRRLSNGIKFFVGDTDVGSNVTSNLPAGTITMNPLFGVITTAGAVAHEIQSDFVGARSFHNRWVG